jgi:hypothetical protein
MIDGERKLLDKEKELRAAADQVRSLNETLRAESKLKEELGLSNSSLEDRIHKLEMERE